MRQSIADAAPSGEGAKPAKDWTLLSAGGEFRFDNGLRLNARLDSALSSNAQTYTGFFGASYTW